MDKLDGVKIKGQATIEYALAFTITMLFLVLVVKMFAWFCGTTVRRHEAFEQTRNATAGGAVQVDFYNQSNNELKLF
jgi:hypothetical protein